MKKHISFISPLFIWGAVLFLFLNIFVVLLMLYSILIYSLVYILPLLIFIAIVFFNVLLIYSMNLKGLYIKNDKIYFDRDMYGYKSSLYVNEIETIEIVDHDHNVIEKDKKIYSNILLIFYLKSSRRKTLSVEYITTKKIKIIESLFLRGKMNKS